MDIQSACDFAYKKLHMASANQYSPRVFDEWLMSSELMVNGIDETLIVISFANTELLRILYRDNGVADEWEDINSIYAFRSVDDKVTREIADIINNIASNAELRFQKSMLNNGYILHIQTNAIIDPDKYESSINAICELSYISDNSTNLSILLFSADGMYYQGNIAEM